MKEVDEGVVGKGKNKTCRANLSTLIWLLCKVMIISLFLVPSYLVFCLKQIYFAGWSPRSKVICHGKRMFPYSPSAKTNQQKRLKEIGTSTTVQCIYHCYPIYLHKLLNEVEYDVKDYPDWREWWPPQISIILHII